VTVSPSRVTERASSFLNYVVFLIAVCVLAVCSLTAPLPPVVIAFPQYDYTANVSTALDLLPVLVDCTSITAAAIAAHSLLLV
jgi:hypothetical protein